MLFHQRLSTFTEDSMDHHIAAPPNFVASCTEKDRVQLSTLMRSWSWTLAFQVELHNSRNVFLVAAVSGKQSTAIRLLVTWMPRLLVWPILCLAVVDRCSQVPTLLPCLSEFFLMRLVSYCLEARQFMIASRYWNVLEWTVHGAVVASPRSSDDALNDFNCAENPYSSDQVSMSPATQALCPSLTLLCAGQSLSHGRPRPTPKLCRNILQFEASSSPRHWRQSSVVELVVVRFERAICTLCRTP